MRFLAVCLLLWPLAQPAPAGERPNVLVILADDYGWRDLSCTGSTFYETPNLDRLFASGVRFDRGYASCQVCSPTRASLLTGKAPARHGITNWIGAHTQSSWRRNTRLYSHTYVNRLPAADVTLSEALRAAGYTTFFAGKWHLGGEGSLPTDHGFDTNIGGFHAGSPKGGYFSPYKNPQMEDGPDGERLPERLARETAGFIERHEGSPFFAMLSFYSVHSPIQSTHADWEKYRAKAEGLGSAGERFVVDRTLPVRQVQDNPIYAGMVEAMDSAIGLVLDTLDRHGLTEDTVVVFTSDNGGVASGDGYATSNLPLRGGKGRQWEGGLRVPLAIAWPGRISGGQSVEEPAITTDIYPTVLDLAGLPVSPEQHRDGVSLAPLLRGQTLASRPLFWHYPHYGGQGGEPSSVVLADDWKLIRYHEDGRQELYHLATDLSEQHDRALEEPATVARLAGLLDAWLDETAAELPVTNPGFDPEGYEQQQAQRREVLKPRLEARAAELLQAGFTPNNGWWGSATAGATTAD